MLKKIKSSIKTSGWWVTFAYTLHRILKILPNRSGCFLYFIYEQPLQAKPKVVTQRPVSKRISHHWFETFDPTQADLPRPIKTLKERFSQETECLLVKQDNELAGCSWFSHKQYIEDEVRCTFDFSSLPEHVWDYDIYIFPKYRLSRMFMRMWGEAEKQLTEKGFKYSLSRITAYNISSIKAHERLGAIKINWVCFFNVLGLQLMISPMSPYCHISLSKHSIAKVQIHK